MFVARAVTGARREKFIRGEFDPAEQFTGIIRRRYTFFFGNAEIIGRNHHLHVAYDLYDGKQTDGCEYRAHLRTGGKVIAVYRLHTFGEAIARFKILRCALAQFGGKGNGFCNLNGCLGHVAAVLHAIGRAGIRREHFYVAFAAEQDDLFVEYGYAVYRGASVWLCVEHIQRNIEIKGHVYGIESAVEGDGL